MRIREARRLTRHKINYERFTKSREMPMMCDKKPTRASYT